MTVSALNPADPPVVAAYHLTCLLGVSGCTLSRYIADGLVPRPDGRAKKGLAIWRLSTIRAWRPDLVRELTPLISRVPAKLILPIAA